MTLPVADTWFSSTKVAPGVTRISEPHAHLLIRANMFLVEGAERDMIVDTGCGVIPLRPFVDSLRADPGKEIVCVSTHTHIDHIGGVHEFDTRLVHPIEADEMAAPSAITSILRKDLPDWVRDFVAPQEEVLLHALPFEGYDPAGYRLRGAAATGLLEEGDRVDLGDRRFEVIHLPGHSPGGIGLWESGTGTLFAGDAIYDGTLIYEGPGTSIKAYRETFGKLKGLAVGVVHGGHNGSFGAERMAGIIADHEGLWGG